ncbi:MAG: alanine racemase [Gemmatimonadota bacterium]|nr:alanine racemase [Gemmatimonadota bacterium]
MPWSRRSFLSASASALTTGAAISALTDPVRATGAFASSPTTPFEPWLELDAAAVASNAREVARLAGGRPVLAVVKNNGYGLGVGLLGRILRDVDEVAGAAVVTPGAAHELVDAGLDKPVLLMARVDDGDGEELVRRGVRLATTDERAGEQIARIAGRVGSRVRVHAYLDTGMSRLGVPFRSASAFLSELASSGHATVEGVFMGFAEDDDFDAVQLRRFREVTEVAKRSGAALGLQHAASSHGLFFRPEAHLDLVRPGLAIFGAYPAGARDANSASLVPAFRMKARVARVSRLSEGDGVSYGREYVATQPTWVATLPVGHADGYPRRAVDGCEVLIGPRTYPVIGAVSASHTIVEIGPTRAVDVGDEAVLVGPDHPAIHPNEISERAGISVYDVLMHLSARLPRVVT